MMHSLQSTGSFVCRRALGRARSLKNLKVGLVIKEFCDWLSNTSISVAFQSANWFVPLVQTVHIISIAILLTGVYVLSFRLIGVTRGGQSLAVLTAKSTPWIWIALGVLLGTGILLTITEPARELLNWAFRVKMLMVIALAAILLVVQMRMRRHPAYWTESPTRRRVARAIGIVAVIIGAGIVTAGRWIAYV
jgi:hypothetical protein